ncbi:hypothetical protein MKX03_013638 [Papaver bracteatum]|nr:hypothetical protein MKX03_013638 [Papaver bracteatum]
MVRKRTDPAGVTGEKDRVIKDAQADQSIITVGEPKLVGLENDGVTCYINSLLQTLYHLPYFRKLVYCMPTSKYDLSPLALKTLFCKLQLGNQLVVDTKEWTDSFKWTTQNQVFQHHDVQEYSMALYRKLEDIMETSPVEGSIKYMFEGHYKRYTNCINVGYKTDRVEPFSSLQLVVKGCVDVYASFDKYVKVERLEGDNKYKAPEHGLQEADRSVLFTDFPRVLQLQLERYEYDDVNKVSVKLDDRHEFPLHLDLDN